MFYHNIQNYLDLGFLQIRYYGLIYALGFIIIYFMLKYQHKYFKISLKNHELLDLIMYMILGIVIGARLFYVFIYNPVYYLKNPLDIFAIWQGGLSFHGGLIGYIIGTLLYSIKFKKNFLGITDATALPVALSLSFGRIGNFINAELIGTITNLPFCIKYKGIEGCRHPSQIYEAIKNLIIFGILFFTRKKKWKEGTYSAIFIIMYSILRFFIGFYRAPDNQLGYIFINLTMGQILNIIMFFLGIVFLIYLYKKEIVLNHKKKSKY